jgi:ankyrin repeat protein
MLKISANDPRAVALANTIRTGDTTALARQLEESPELASAYFVDDSGALRTALHLVADWPGHFPNGARSVALIAAAGGDVNARNREDATQHGAETPLHWAASSDDVAVLDALLDAGADIEAGGAVFTGGPAMSDAVVFAQWNAARRLLERGAKTTIWQSAALGLLDRVELALAVHDVTDRDVTNAFWHACRGGQRSTAMRLLERGADQNWVGYDRRTPLDVAEESGNQELVQWLTQSGGKRFAESVATSPNSGELL